MRPLLFLGFLYMLLALDVAAQCGNGSAPCCGDGICDSGEDCSSCARDCNKSDGTPCQRVGMFYSGWHLPAYNAVAQLMNQGLTVLSVEDVVRSRSATDPSQQYSLNDMLTSNNVAGLAFNMYYQYKPYDGFYCIYSARQPGDLNYNSAHEGTYLQFQVSDCPDWEATVTRHAAQLSSAGIDFVVIDMTNLVQYDNTADAIQLRPLEVLVQTWGNLRAQGITVPDVAAWQRMPIEPAYLGDGGSWMYPYVLNVYNDPSMGQMIMKDNSGNKIFFIPDTGDYDPGFESDVQSNSGRNGITTLQMWIGKQSSGTWSFFDCCREDDGSPMQFFSDSDCNQQPTTSPVGSQLSVSPSYQFTYASEPWQASGVYSGITFRKQFKTAFNLQPDYLLLSSWNEQVAAPLQVGAGPPMGLESDPVGDTATFTDTYGIEFGRDIEPTSEYGSMLYDIMASCLRVFRSGSGFPPASSTDICDDAQEMCCTGPAFGDAYTYYGQDTAKFGLFSPALGPGLMRQEIYVCNGGSGTFLSSDPGCEGVGSGANLVGSVSTQKASGAYRTLTRCSDLSYSLTIGCGGSVLGYVR